MARAIAGATISFGLVSIPVKLYSATQASAGVSFNLLHAKCGSRLKQQYICARDSEIVGLDQMDPVYFDKAYYLGPEKGGEKAYRLLSEAMRETGRAGLARYAARGKQYLVLLRPSTDHEGGIIMQQLLYADEVRPFSDVPMVDAEVRE